MAAGVTQILEAASQSLVALAMGPLHGDDGPGALPRDSTLAVRAACPILLQAANRWHSACQPFLQQEEKDPLHPLFGCPWISRSRGTLLHGFNPWVVHEAVRLVSAAQADCVLREVRQARAVGRLDLIHQLNGRVWLPDWLWTIASARHRCMWTGDVQSATSAGRLVAMCLQKIPSAVLGRWY